MDSVPLSSSAGTSYDCVVAQLHNGYEAMKKMDIELHGVQEQWLKRAQDLLIHLQPSITASASADACLQEDLAVKCRPSSLEVNGSASKAPAGALKSSKSSLLTTGETSVSREIIGRQVQYAGTDSNSSGETPRISFQPTDETSTPREISGRHVQTNDGTAANISGEVPRISRGFSRNLCDTMSFQPTCGSSASRAAIYFSSDASVRLPESAARREGMRRLTARQAARKRRVEKLKTFSNVSGVLLIPAQGGASLCHVVHMVRSTCRNVEAHQAFHVAVFTAIFTNVILTGIELDYLATSPDKRGKSETFDMIQLAYTSIFSVEILIRLFAHGSSFFTRKSEWSWNVFDLIIVGGALVEALDFKHVDMTQFRTMRVMRATRLIRTVRIVRMIRFIRALRSLVFSIMMSLRQVVWSVLLLLIIIFSFSVAFVQAAVDHCSQSKSFRSGLVASGCDDASLAKFWGTIPRAMLTLFMSITGGVSWNEATDSLGLISPTWLFMFLIYVTFTALAVMNVVTAVFCQSAMESVQLDRDQATMQLLANKDLYREALDKLFEDMDADHSGAITLNEFDQALQRDDVNAYLESLDLSMDDAWHLFKILDVDCAGVLDKDDFIMGCIHLKGGAKTVDIAKMSYDSRLADSILESNMQHIEEQIDKLRSSVVAAVNELRGLRSIVAI